MLVQRALTMFWVVPLIGLLGCDSTESQTQEPLDAEPAATLEAVAFDAIGSGKIVFQRIAAGHEAVYVVDADVRTSWGFTGGVLDGPCVSPDGRKIAFARLSGAVTWYDVFVVDMHGGNPQNVAPIPGQAQAPSWTPDGRHIVYISNFSIYVDTTQVYRSQGMSLDRRVSASATLDLLIPAWSRIERLDSGASTPEIWIAPDSTVLGDLVATWSPAGDQIAHIWIRKTERQHELELWVMDDDRSNHRRVAALPTRDPGSGSWSGDNDLSVAWSPDGSRIAFSVPEAGFVSHIYVAAVDGSHTSQITTADGVTDRSVSWSR